MHKKNPLVEYKKEAFILFETVHFRVAEESIEKLFKIQVREEESFEKQAEYKDQNLQYDKAPAPSAPSARRPVCGQRRPFHKGPWRCDYE